MQSEVHLNGTGSKLRVGSRRYGEEASMDLPPDKAKLLKQYDDEKKWDIICDQLSLSLSFLAQSKPSLLHPGDFNASPPPDWRVREVFGSMLTAPIVQVPMEPPFSESAVPSHWEPSSQLRECGMTSPVGDSEAKKVGEAVPEGVLWSCYVWRSAIALTCNENLMACDVLSNEYGYGFRDGEARNMDEPNLASRRR
ncbi:Formin-like protein [Gryllus bimaculatus]|nr:Formin-like protein [Gryllus bimaculatus]